MSKAFWMTFIMAVPRAHGVWNGLTCEIWVRPFCSISCQSFVQYFLSKVFLVKNISCQKYFRWHSFASGPWSMDWFEWIKVLSSICWIWVRAAVQIDFQESSKSEFCTVFSVFWPFSRSMDLFPRFKWSEFCAVFWIGVGEEINCGMHFLKKVWLREASLRQ